MTEENSFHSEVEEHEKATERMGEKAEGLIEDIEDDEDILSGTPLPPDAPRNWSALVAIISLVVGVVVGFVVPVIGFAFYIICGFIALMFSVVSLVTFRKFGIPAPTIGALICSLFLLGWGIFHAITFATTAMTVLSFMQDGGAMIGTLAEQAGVEL